MEIAPLDGQPAKILLVDDDPIMRELASAKLAEAGHDVITAEDGAAALDRMDGKDIDLVISDLDMPRLNGFELTKKIRNSRFFGETPVIVITGSESRDAVERAFAAGATSFLAKPINWTLFNHSVRFVLRASENQKELRHARDLAEAGSQFKDSLMSVMSHELHTPLNAIIGFGQLLGEQFVKENDHLHREYADYIVDGGKRLLNSVSDMLLASDASSGPITINEVDCTIGELIDLSCAAADKVVGLRKANLKVAVHDRDTEVCCDRTLISRAISKLIDNSVKFSEPGVTIIVGAAVLDDGSLAFLVKDDGPGLDAETLKSVTQPFSQSDMSLRRSKEGLGLGLPLVTAIAQAHGGSFKLDSTPGSGARAVFTLPENRIVAAQQNKKTAIA